MNKTVRKNLSPYVFLLVFIIGCLLIVNLFDNTVTELTYDEFMNNLNNNEVTSLTITPKTRTETYEIIGTLKDYEENEKFILYIPMSDEFLSKVTTAADTSEFTLTIQNDPEASEWLQIIAEWLPILLLVGVSIWLFSKQLGGNNKSMDFGKSKAKLLQEGTQPLKM